jgi:hypothetical protein
MPDSIEALIKSIDEARRPIAIHDVESSLLKARQALGDVRNDDLNRAIWGEIVAFSMVTDAGDLEPWRAYFGPLGSKTFEDGRQEFFPEVREIDAPILDHWISRVKTVSHPVLKARYADLAWELARRIDGRRPAFEHATAAIDAYLDSVESSLTAEFHDQMEQSCRALDLACSIRNKERIIRARDVLLAIHNRAIAGEGFWWRSFDRLICEKNADLSDKDRENLANSLEGLAIIYAKTDDPAAFNPYHLESVAKRLATYYLRLGSRNDVVRINELIGRTFEHVATLGNAMQASSNLQTAENAYLDAGMSEDAKRARVARGKAIRQSREEMQEFSISGTITLDEMESFLDQVITVNPVYSFARIANQFVWRTDVLEKAVKDMVEHAPLMSMMPVQVMAADHKAADIGAVEDDLDGRVCQQAMQNIQWESLFLQRALERAIETHKLNPHFITGFAGRSDLFEDLTFVHAGVEAWFAGDYMKQIFILTPQIEHALRNLTGGMGEAVTRKHPTVPGREISVGMGEILSNKVVQTALGRDLLLYFKVIYSDPRGLNLRNSVAHGLLERGLINSVVGDRLIHTLLVLGLWRELTDRQRSSAGR